MVLLVTRRLSPGAGDNLKLAFVRQRFNEGETGDANQSGYVPDLHSNEKRKTSLIFPEPRE